MLVPPIAQRREIDRNLVAYFRDYRITAFRQAISGFCRFYSVKRPRIEWYEYIDRGRTAGRTFEDGRIHLVHPENWKRCRVYKSERMWVQTVYHELAHYVFWTDAERKAEAFTLRMVRGLKRSLRRVGADLRLASASNGRSARRGPQRERGARPDQSRIRPRRRSPATRIRARRAVHRSARR
ncbi:MAG TPA: hypothetical protein VJN94_00235 [Candidatus Binataceae bacterium]|nr:hypothetical protein [Candidatus Binataceae bacterium]